jgi:hypothetical protein
MEKGNQVDGEPNKAVNEELPLFESVGIECRHAVKIRIDSNPAKSLAGRAEFY